MTPADTADLVQQARRWRDADPDPFTRSQMDEVLRRADPDELAELVGTELRFGTAGLRAPLGPGPNRMNRLVVHRAATALAQLLVDGSNASISSDASDGPPLVLVGHDERHGSERFARDVTEVLTSHGIDVGRFDEAVPTPLVAGAVRDLRAAAAVVVTASHNPATDNGLKVYAADGAQIVPPTDRDIADRMDRLALEPFGPTDTIAVTGRAGQVRSLGGPGSGGEVTTHYLARVRALATGRSPERLRVAHTSLHGVGHRLLTRALEQLDWVEATAVASQCEPDPDFPTVASPNPEEPGALDRLIALAGRVDADVAIALDPDGDRLAVALPRTTAAGSTWQQLTGDEVGALLTADLIAAAHGTADPLVVTTVVSSRLVPSICQASGVHHAETLTGFKWLCRPAIDHPAWHQLLAYEEALGYAVGPDARDKDGIGAAVATLCALGTWRRDGRSAWAVLDDLARRHGAHVTRNASVALAKPADVGPRVRALSGRRTLGDVAVVAVDHPGADMTRLVLADRTRVIVRPSGTEPKLKYYVEAIEQVRPGGDVAAARRVAADRADDAARDLTTLLGPGAPGQPT